MENKYILEVTVDEDWIKEDAGLSNVKDAIEKAFKPLRHDGIFLDAIKTSDN